MAGSPSPSLGPSELGEPIPFTFESVLPQETDYRWSADTDGSETDDLNDLTDILVELENECQDEHLNEEKRDAYLRRLREEQAWFQANRHQAIQNLIEYKYASDLPEMACTCEPEIVFTHNLQVIHLDSKYQFTSLM